MRSPCRVHSHGEGDSFYTENHTPPLVTQWEHEMIEMFDSPDNALVLSCFERQSKNNEHKLECLGHSSYQEVSKCMTVTARTRSTAVRTGVTVAGLRCQLWRPHRAWFSHCTSRRSRPCHTPPAGVFALFYVSNRFRTFPFSAKDQCIIFYSGVRGAGSFSLAFLLPLSLFPRKNMFVTATLVVIYFTVFIQVGKFYSYLK